MSSYKILVFFGMVFLFLSIGFVYAYTAPSYTNVTLSFEESYTAPSYTNVTLFFGEEEVPTECSPTVDQTWDITDAQICDGVNVDVGTGAIHISPNGNLSIVNGANVTANGLEINATGERVFIYSDSLLELT